MYSLHFPKQSNKLYFSLLISIYSLLLSTQTIASSNDVQQHEIIFRVPDIPVPNFKDLAAIHDTLSIDQIRNKLVETSKYISLDSDCTPTFEYKTNQKGSYEKIDREPHLVNEIASIKKTQLKDLKPNTGINISLTHQVESDIKIGESHIFYENHINRTDDDSRGPGRCVETIDYACITFPDNITKIDYTQLGLTKENTVEECRQKIFENMKIQLAKNEKVYFGDDKLNRNRLKEPMHNFNNVENKMLKFEGKIKYPFSAQKEDKQPPESHTSNIWLAVSFVALSATIIIVGYTYFTKKSSQQKHNVRNRPT